MQPNSEDSSRNPDPEMTFDHLGLVVRRLEKGREALSVLLQGMQWTDIFRDEVNGVSCQFGRDTSGLVYELLEPLGRDSPVAPALAERKSILNHVAYRVPDLQKAAERLALQRCAPAGPPRPALAYAGRPIQFFVTPLNFIIELIEAPRHTHLFQSGNAGDFKINASP